MIEHTARNFVRSTRSVFGGTGRACSGFSRKTRSPGTTTWPKEQSDTSPYSGRYRGSSSTRLLQITCYCWASHRLAGSRANRCCGSSCRERKMWMVSVAPAITHKDDEQIVVASIGMRRKQESFHNAIRDAVRRLG